MTPSRRPPAPPPSDPGPSAPDVPWSPPWPIMPRSGSSLTRRSINSSALVLSPWTFHSCAKPYMLNQSVRFRLNLNCQDLKPLYIPSS